MFMLLVVSRLHRLRLRVEGDLDNMSEKRGIIWGIIIHNKHDGDGSGLHCLRLRVEGDLDNVSEKRGIIWGIIVHNKHDGDVT